KEEVTSEMVDMVLLRDNKKIKLQVPIGQLGVILQEYLPDHQVAHDAVMIDGIGKLDWGIGMDNSFLACVYLLEQKFGNQLSYADLVGLSGYGFKLNFFDRYCPSSPDATVGFDSGGYLMQKLGYKVDYYYLQTDEQVDDNVESMAEEGMRMLILDSIDRGWPVIAIDLIDTPEWGLITGYQNKDSDFFCRTFFDKTEGYEIAQKFPWVILIIKDKLEAEIEPLYNESLKLAKQLYETPRYYDYFSGITAVLEWIKALKDEQYYNENANNMAEISHANWWIFVSLEIARGICSEYLSTNIEKFGVDPDKITQLAELYRAEADLLIDNYDMLPNQFAQAPVPWTTEMRAKQIAVMEEFLELEEKAFQIIKEF
ncbi:MAG: hypothetical protein Q7J16_09010, partial [Candidatus Cloacimonadales bacterium]|nr:hypothetical protein [Candidatus Cloacimonadales bacterium]